MNNDENTPIQSLSVINQKAIEAWAPIRSGLWGGQKKNRTAAPPAPKVAQVPKKLMSGGGWGGLRHFFPRLKIYGSIFFYTE